MCVDQKYLAGLGFQPIAHRNLTEPRTREDWSLACDMLRILNRHLKSTIRNHQQNIKHLSSCLGEIQRSGGLIAESHKSLSEAEENCCNTLSYVNVKLFTFITQKGAFCNDKMNQSCFHLDSREERAFYRVHYTSRRLSINIIEKLPFDLLMC